MSEIITEYVTYAHHPTEAGEAALVAKIFRDAAAEAPVPVLVWFHSGGFHSGSIESKSHARIATRFVDRGYACAFVEYRLRARAEDLREETRALLPELVADAEANSAEIRPNMTGARALAAVEDGAAFLDWLQDNGAAHGISERIVLGGSSAGGMTVLNLLSLAPRLGLPLPPVPTALVMSGAFAYPSFFTPTSTRVLAIHGSHEWQIPVSSIRAHAARDEANCTLLEERQHAHGDLRLNREEPLWRSVERLIRFDRGEEIAAARTAAGDEPVKDVHKICIFTCVKNEGPFLLEWIAYNRSIGVTDFVIFSNDCVDGTTELLDRLDALGIVNHIPNPSMAMKSREHLRLTVACAPYHKAFFTSDYVILTDVDEFIQVNVGDGTLNGLIAAAGYPDVLSLSELFFGFAGIESFQNKLVTEQFRVAQTLDPPEENARRGVKSIMRVTRAIREYSNHRPQLWPEALDDIHWVDGSGARALRPFIRRGHRGVDSRGRYRLAQINHYTLRSGESMLLKMHRGDAVRPGRMREEYFSHRNGRDEVNDAIARRIPALRAELEQLLQDKELPRLHRTAVARHRKMISILKEHPDYAEIWEAIRQEAARPCQDDEAPAAAE